MAAKRLPWPRTLRARATVAATLLVAGALIIGNVGLLWLVRYSQLRDIDARLSAEATVFADLAKEGALPSLVSFQDALMQVVDPTQRVVAATPAMQLQPAMLRSVPNVAATTVRDTRLPLAPGADFRVLARGTTDAEGHQLFVYAATNLSPLNRSLRNVGNLLRYVVPALIWIVGLTTWWIVGRSLGRVEAMRAEVADITASSLERRVPRPAADDELGRLAGTMNAMLERIESAAARQRQFIGDASHELQSPLAASRTQLEVALTYPERAEWAQVAADVLREHDRMEQLVRDLLLLARVDESALVDSRRPVELGELVCGEAARLTNGHGATIDLTGVAPITVTGDPLALARVVSNLLENACRHAASDVWVSVEGDGNDVVLTVEDDGPGVPLVERSRIFERFARVEHARARDAGGTGLGLAIVKDVVEAHGGSVAVADGARGARFTVTLPRRTPDPSSS